MPKIDLPYTSREHGPSPASTAEQEKRYRDVEQRAFDVEALIERAKQEAATTNARADQLKAECKAKGAEIKAMEAKIADLKAARLPATDGYILNATVAAGAPEGTYMALAGKSLKRHQVEQLVQQACEVNDVAFAAGIPVDALLPHLTNPAAMTAAAIGHIRSEAEECLTAARTIGTDSKRAFNGFDQLNKVNGHGRTPVQS
jgi:hypothetical protein